MLSHLALIWQVTKQLTALILPSLTYSGTKLGLFMPMARRSFIFFFTSISFLVPVQAQIHSNLLLQNESFVSPGYTATNQTQYQFLGFRAHSEVDESSFVVDSEVVMAMGAPLLSYIKIQDFALQYENSPNEVFSIGRKKQLWSGLDHRWNYGIIEPTFKWNPLNRKSLALTGIHWNRDEKDFSMTAIWSPFFLPNQGPNFEIDDNGQFTRKNPWFPTPPDTFRPFPNATTDSSIQYKVQRPPDSEVISQSTLGGTIEKNWMSDLLTRTGYFYKPMNDLALSYNGAYVLATDQGQVDLLPEVIYHRVLTADVVYRYGLIETGISYINDKPTNRKPDPEWTVPIYEDAQIYSTYVQLSFKKSNKISLEYLIVDGGRVVEVGDLASPARAPISSRYPMTEAYKLRHQSSLRLKNIQRVSFDTSWTHSDRNQFDLIQIQGSFQIKKDWQVYTDMQFLKAKPLNANNVNDVASFVDNDRLMVGVAHAL